MSIPFQDLPVIKQGADFQATFPLQSSEFNSSEVQFYCSIKRFPGGPSLVEVSVTWDGTTLTFSIPASETSKLPPTGALGSPASVPLVFDVIGVTNDGTRFPIVDGRAFVDPRVTVI